MCKRKQDLPSKASKTSSLVAPPITKPVMDPLRSVTESLVWCTLVLTTPGNAPAAEPWMCDTAGGGSAVGRAHLVKRKRPCKYNVWLRCLHMLQNHAALSRSKNNVNTAAWQPKNIVSYKQLWHLSHGKSCRISMSRKSCIENLPSTPTCWLRCPSSKMNTCIGRFAKVSADPALTCLGYSAASANSKVNTRDCDVQRDTVHA